MAKLSTNNKELIVKILVFVVIMSCLFFLLLGIKNLNSEYIEKLSSLGQYYSGSIGIILNFATIVALVLTFVLQRKQFHSQQVELKVTNDSNQVQLFESSFFQMLSLFKNLLSEKLYNNQTVRDEITKLQSDIINSKDIKNLDSLSVEEAKEKIRSISNSIVDNTEFFLGHYFRSLFQLLKFIDSKKELLLSFNTSKFYTNIVRNQLMQSELFVVFFIGISDKAKYNSESELSFKILAERYNLFEHLRFRPFYSYNIRKILFLYNDFAYEKAKIDEIRKSLTQ
ncbi:MAG: putative phage abortive infection protein [Ignavibacteria bacterium]|nr:putative phage abortive infection protein [Ignavibacteria bacterium]